MNEPQSRREDLSRSPSSPLPTPGTTNLGLEQPTPPGVLFGNGRRSFEQPAGARWTDKARHIWDETRHEAEDVAISVSHKAQDLVCQVTGWIRQHPGTSLLCGFSIGFLLADTILYMRSNRR